MEMCSVYVDCEYEALRHKWIESERAQRDLGEAAMKQWVREHWFPYLRARWAEHLQGVKFWKELDRGDFALLRRDFGEDQLLVDRIVDRLKAGKENLDIIQWAFRWNLPLEKVVRVLEALDVNRCRLNHRLDS